MDIATGKLHIKPNTAFQHLPAFVKFILDNKLEEFIRFQLKISHEVDAPIMKYFANIPEDDLVKMSIEPTRDYWIQLVSGDVEFQITDAINKWKANQIPMISRDQVVADDITKGNYVRKTAFNHFLPEYTNDFKLYSEISGEIDYYLQILASTSFQAYIDIQNEKLEAANKSLQKNEEQLLEAQAIANVGSFEWSLDGKQPSTFTPQLFKIFELDEGAELSEFLQYVHPEDRDKLQNSIVEAMHTGGVCETEYRYKKGDTEKNIWSKGLLTFENGMPSFMKGTVMDITERQKVLQKLTEQDELYKQSQAITHIGNWHWLIKEDKVFWSDELYRIYGLEPQSENITVARFSSFIHPEDKEARKAQIYKAIETGVADDYTMRIVQPNGNVRVLRGKSEIVKDKTGTAIKMVGTCQDITSEYKLLKQLEEENKFAETLINASVDVILAFDKKLTLIAINSRAEEMYNVKREDVLGKNMVDVFPVLQNTTQLEELKRGLNGERIFVPDSKSLIRGEKFFERYVIPLSNSDGEIYAALTIGRDITEIKKNTIRVSELNYSLEQKNELLRRSQEQYERMISEVQDYAIISLDMEGNVLNWNLGAEKIKGYSNSEIVGKNFRKFYLPEDLEAGLPEKLLNEAIEQGRASHEGWRVRKDGTRFWGNVVITALHDANRDVIGFSKVTRDLTERKIAEEQLYATNKLLEQLNHSLELKNQLLERSNKELSAFSYVASHDLQEPIRKIKTFANLITETEAEELQPKHKQLLERIITASNNMQRLIEDLLAFSRTHNSTETFEKLDLNDLLQGLKSDFIISNKEGAVEINIGDMPVIEGIPFQLTQLFQNLIGNSIKYGRTDEPVKVDISYTKASGNNIQHIGIDISKQYHLITVSDNGIGFDQKYAERIFEPFQRLHGKNEYSGTGIGLAICKKIVQNHEGVIYAKSTPLNGAEFYVAIPVNIPNKN